MYKRQEDGAHDHDEQAAEVELTFAHVLEYLVPEGQAESGEGYRADDDADDHAGRAHAHRAARAFVERLDHHAGSHAVPSRTPVSYTHLDVYKRQNDR